MIEVRHGIILDIDALAEICRRFRVRELSLFGSVLRDDFRDDSDVDVLVEFEPGAEISLFDISNLKFELQDLFKRDVDVVSKRGLRPGYREHILATNELLYAA